MKGYADDEQAVYEVERDEGSTVLTRQLPDGSTMVRRIRFSAEDPGKVLFETTFTHHGASAKTYQFRVRPELATHTKTGDSKVLVALVKRERWVQFNRQWREDSGPDAKLLEGAAGGGLAFWNDAAKFGLRVSYDPAQFGGTRFRWLPDRAQANLELITAQVELQPGQSLSYAYQFEHLAEPPTL